MENKKDKNFKLWYNEMKKYYIKLEFKKVHLKLIVIKIVAKKEGTK